VPEEESAAAGGLVVATVSGSGEVTGLKIDPKLADPVDTETLADAVVAAIRAANAAAEQIRADRMGPLESGLTQLGGGLGVLPALTG
jgi:DNA-binding protein YbaB